MTAITPAVLEKKTYYIEGERRKERNDFSFSQRQKSESESTANLGN